MSFITYQLSVLLFLLFVCFTFENVNGEDGNADHSNLSRRMASIGARTTRPLHPRQKRASYPEQNPHICLAFLSCCERTDLLNHTLNAAIRHMEEDEPDWLRYEIAWVDNGNGKSKTTGILENYEIEHALTLPHNMGLAYGMNLLIFNLCRAQLFLFQKLPYSSF